MASSAVAPFMRIENLLCASPAGMFGLTPTTATFTTSTTATFTGPTPSSSSLSLSFDANSNNIMNKMSKKIGNLSPSREVQIPTVPTTEKKISLKCALAITNKTHNSNMVTKKPQELLSQSRHLLLSQPQPQLEHQQQPKRVHSSNHHQQGHPIKLFSVGPSPFQSLPMTKITSVQNSLQQLQPQQPQPQPQQPQPPHNEITMAVFVNEIRAGSVPCFVRLNATHEANLWDLSTKIQAQTHIAKSNQTLSFLVSPAPQVYNMLLISELDGRRTNIPSSAIVLVTQPQSQQSQLQQLQQQQHSPTTSSSSNEQQQPPPQPQPQRGINTFSLRAGRQLKVGTSASTATNPSNAQDAILNEVRNQLTEVLCDIRKHVSLDMIARMTNRSKSSLSLWRRGLYRGNNTMIAKAVTQAMFQLQARDWVYDPLVHVACVPFQR